MGSVLEVQFRPSGDVAAIVVAPLPPAIATKFVPVHVIPDQVVFVGIVLSCHVIPLSNDIAYDEVALAVPATATHALSVELYAKPDQASVAGNVIRTHVKPLSVERAATFVVAASPAIAIHTPLPNLTRDQRLETGNTEDVHVIPSSE